jgi:hypothetical protein
VTVGEGRTRGGGGVQPVVEAKLSKCTLSSISAALRVSPSKYWYVESILSLARQIMALATRSCCKLNTFAVNLCAHLPTTLASHVGFIVDALQAVRICHVMNLHFFWTYVWSCRCWIR